MPTVPKIQPEKVTAVVVPPQEQPSPKLSLRNRPFLLLWIGIIVLGILLGFGVWKYVGMREQTPPSPEKVILAKIGETVVTQADANTVKRIQNGIAAYQQISQLTDEQAKEVAIFQGKVTEEARSRNISVIQVDVDSEIARLEQQGGKSQTETLLLAYHISRDDWVWVVRGRLLQERLEQALVSSIDAQILSLRFDAKLAARDVAAETLQNEARPILTQTIDQLRNTPYATVAAAFIQQYADHPRLDPKTTPNAPSPTETVTLRQKDVTDPKDTTNPYTVLSSLPEGNFSQVTCTTTHCWVGKVVAKRGSIASLEELIGGPKPW